MAYLGGQTVEAKLYVDGEGHVEHGGSLRQLKQFSLRRKYEDLL